MSINLWNINKWLRYTGFRIFVQPKTESTPTKIGILFGGFPYSKKWKKWEGE